MNKELFDAMVETQTNLNGQLDPEAQRFIDKHVLERKLNGLHLDEETRKKVTDLKEKISDLSVEYSKNFNEENTKLTFTLDQLGKFQFQNK